MQTIETEFGEPDRKGNANNIKNNMNNNTANYKNIVREKHENNSRDRPSDIPYSRQVSNRVRSKMTSAKQKIRSTTPIMGFASGLLLWIPGFGSGKQNQSSRSSNSPNINGNENLREKTFKLNQGIGCGDILNMTLPFLFLYNTRQILNIKTNYSKRFL